MYEVRWPPSKSLLAQAESIRKNTFIDLTESGMWRLIGRTNEVHVSFWQTVAGVGFICECKTSEKTMCAHAVLALINMPDAEREKLGLTLPEGIVSGDQARAEAEAAEAEQAERDRLSRLS